MNWPNLLILPAVFVCLAGQAIAADPYRNPPEYVLPPEVTYTSGYESRDHLCGALLLPGWKWSDWYVVTSKCDVELQVRYRMKNVGARGARSFMQLRYVNRSNFIRTASVSKVRLHFHDSPSDLIWSGESLTVNPQTIAYGTIQTLDGRLCTWNKLYQVR